MLIGCQCNLHSCSSALGHWLSVFPYFVNVNVISCYVVMWLVNVNVIGLYVAGLMQMKLVGCSIGQ